MANKKTFSVYLDSQLIELIEKIQAENLEYKYMSRNAFISTIIEKVILDLRK